MSAFSDVVDSALLRAMLDGGYVRTQVHPVLPLRIYNYSEKAQYERVWNDVTRQCRGLIVDDRNGTVLARPFRKFFNSDESGAAVIDGEHDVVVTDKMDGSLGILYWADDEWQVATRGSFASDQAKHATAVWSERYAGRVAVPAGWTLLFEIVYPHNRIVLDYGHTDDLVLLGACDVASGRTITPDVAARAAGWPGPVVETMPYASLVDALTAPPRPNREGLVVHSLVSDERVKIKQEDYVRLHRIITGLSNRTVWEHLGEGKPLDDLLQPLPEEFHGWVRSVADGLRQRVERIRTDAETAHAEVLAQMPDGWGRKEYALVAKERPERSLLFLLLDGKRTEDQMWRMVKPERETLPPGIAAPEEDAA